MRFLLIDDDSTQRRWVADRSRAIPGFALVEAADTAALAAALAGASYNLHRSPGWTGLTHPLCCTSFASSADLSIIIFTAAGSEEAAVAAFKAGANDYLNAEQRERLPEMVAACLEASRQATAARA